WRAGAIGAIVIATTLMLMRAINLAELGAGLLLIAHPVVAARFLAPWCRSLTGSDDRFETNGDGNPNQ
ncbi:MAG: hypothetical protein Q4Q03_01220, partial [Bowdeniella nasicola]|nr:hypothetical protein [Bowdeniella nasicola]